MCGVQNPSHNTYYIPSYSQAHTTRPYACSTINIRRCKQVRMCKQNLCVAPKSRMCGEGSEHTFARHVNVCVLCLVNALNISLLHACPCDLTQKNGWMNGTNPPRDRGPHHSSMPIPNPNAQHLFKSKQSSGQKAGNTCLEEQ